MTTLIFEIAMIFFLGVLCSWAAGHLIARTGWKWAPLLMVLSVAITACAVAVITVVAAVGAWRGI